MRRKLGALKNETDIIRSGLDELGIMKMDTKENIEEIRSELISQKEKKRMVRLKIEDIKELSMDLKELESK